MHGMIRRGSAVLLPAFGILLALIVAFAVAVTVVLNRTEVEVARIHESAKQREQVLTMLYSDVHRTALRVRDVLFDAPIRPGGPSVHDLRGILRSHADALESMLGGRDPEAMRSLRAAIHRYGDLSAAVETWTETQRREEARSYLRDTLIPARAEILESAARLAELNGRVLDERQLEVLNLQRRTREHLRTGAILMLLVALLTAVLAIRKVRAAEAQAETQRALTERHEEELRTLSKSLVSSIEQERKVLSRELHDEVGQILTALKMELAALSGLRSTGTPAHESHLAEAKRLAGETLKTVRH
ncbi:MAG: hypothetical protein FJW30_28475, partial [Acidobacteria bacterium]|nr:hypothetical protein [Acidobacteriota bacterium]